MRKLKRMEISDQQITDSTELQPTRRLLLGLIILNGILYTFQIPLSLLTGWTLGWVFYPMILIYYLLEGWWFFGRKSFNWPAFLTFRIMWALHDLVVAIILPFKTQLASQIKDPTIAAPILLSFFLFLITFGIGIAIMCFYSKFPRKGLCSKDHT